MPDPDQVLLPCAQQVAERYQFSGTVAEQWQAILVVRNVHCCGEPIGSTVGIQANAAWADQGQIGQPVADQIRHLALRVEKLCRKSRERCVVRPASVRVEREESGHSRLGDYPVQPPVASQICEGLTNRCG